MSKRHVVLMALVDPTTAVGSGCGTSRDGGALLHLWGRAAPLGAGGGDVLEGGGRGF